MLKDKTKKKKPAKNIEPQDFIKGLVFIADTLQANMGEDASLAIVHRELKLAISSMRQQIQGAK